MPRMQLEAEGMTAHDYLTAESLRELAVPRAEHECVSMYMPAVRSGPETEQNRIRFRNLMDRADDALGELVDRDFRKAIVHRLRSIDGNGDFWRHQGDGLGILASPESIDLYLMSHPPKESVTIGRHFHLLPLLPDMLSEQIFYLLVVSQAEVHVFRCTNHTFHEIELADMPDGREAIDRFIETEDQIQARSVDMSGAARGRHDMILHGQGGSDREGEVRVFEYFNLIEKALRRLVRRAETPIVYAGDHHLFSLFKRAVTSLNVIDDHISGNFDSIHTDYKSVHEKAWPLVEPHLRARRQWVLDNAQRAFNSDRVSTDVRKILRYANQGRVEELVITDTEPLWGKFDPDTGEVTQHNRRHTDSEDLINLAALYAIRQEANLFLADRPDMPEREPILAVFYD